MSDTRGRGSDGAIDADVLVTGDGRAQDGRCGSNGHVRRREVLAGIVAGGTVAALGAGAAPVAAQRRRGGSWPMHQYDAANTGHGPEAVGPKAAVERAWSFGTDTPDAMGPPAVHQGRAFLGIGPRLFALDLRNEEELWRKPMDPGVAGTPAVADGTVYAVTRSGILRAVEAKSSADVWQFGDSNQRVRSSPTVHGDAVYFADGLGRVHAIDRANGRERWVVGRWGYLMTGTPAVDGERLYYMGDEERRFHAVAVADGEEQWNMDPGRRIRSPTLVGDVVVAPGSGEDGTLYALDVADGAVAWSRDVPSTTSPATDGDALYVPSGSTLHAVGVDDGAPRWQLGLGAEVATAPSLADDVLYVATRDGRLHAVDVGEGTTLWTERFAGGAPTEAAVVDGRLHLGSADGSYTVLSGDTSWDAVQDGAEDGGEEPTDGDGDSEGDVDDGNTTGDDDAAQPLSIAATVAGVTAGVLAARRRD